MTDAFKRLAEFQQLVLADPALQRELRDLHDQAVFVELLVQMGAQHGYAFTADEVHMALREARRSWLERWLLP